MFIIIIFTTIMLHTGEEKITWSISRKPSDTEPWLALNVNRKS